MEDIKMYRHNKTLGDFFEAEDIYIVDFGIIKYIKFLISYFTGKIHLPQIETPFDITCYLMSSGNWGSYQLPNIVQFCPLEMDDLSMTTEELLEHEITHLIHEKDVQDMTHKEKEDFIEDKSLSY
jgi:hypothetical protein